MTWAEWLKATWSGDVAGGDVQALLATGGALDALHDQLADRRLTAQIDHIGEEWRVPAAIAPLALPLWLGDGLLTLARSVCDAEAEAHPDRPRSLSAASHDLAVAALQPIETIVAEASAAAADPARPCWLTAVVVVGPRGEVARQSLPMPIPPGYITGLLTAGERLHGAAGLLLGDLTALLQPSQPPAWMTTGIQHVKGNLAASSARLAMLRTRLQVLIPDPQRPPAGLRHETLAPLCHELWEVVNAALTGGQMLADPHLLPGARAAAAPEQHRVPAAPSAPPPHVPVVHAAPPTPTVPPSPAPAVPPARPPARVDRVYDLPDIQTLPTVETIRRQGPERTAQRPLPPVERDPKALPDIGGAAPTAKPAAAKGARSLPEIDVRRRRDDEEVRELPQIGRE